MIATALLALALAGPQSTALRFGGTGMDGGTDIAVAAGGEIFVAGYAENAHDDGKAARIVPSGLDGFLSKYDTKGKLLWTQTFGGRKADVVHSLALDPQGNAVIAGYFTDSAEFGEISLESVSGQDMFVAKFDPDGKCLWARQFGRPGEDEANGIAIAPSGEIYVAGTWGRFEGNEGRSAGLVMQLDSDGNTKWSVSLDSPGDDSATAIAASATRLLVGGQIGGSIDKLNMAGPFGGRDAFVAQFSLAGLPIMARRLGGKLDDSVARGGVAFDAKGQLYVIGSFQDRGDFAGKPLRSAGMADIFFGKLNAADGKAQWMRSFGGKDVDTPGRISLNADGDIFISGSFRASVDFSDTKAIFLEANSKDGDAFVAKYSLAGDYRWSRLYGSKIAHAGGAGMPESNVADPNQPYYSMANGLAVVGPDVIATGRFFGSVPFVTGTRLDSVGLSDGFILRLDSEGN